jgi:hypothetical protein
MMAPSEDPLAAFVGPGVVVQPPSSTPAPAASRPTRPLRGRRVPTPRDRRPGLGAPLALPEPEPEPEPERVPEDLVSAFRSSHGVDVSDVPVHRGPKAAERAEVIQAGAFTSEGEVFLPAEAGPLNEPATRGVLAHELAHVVQQRQLGSALPDERSAEGQLLEEHARAHEDWAKTGAIGAPPISLVAAPPQEQASGPAMIHPKVQRTPRGGSATVTPPAPVTPPTSTASSTSSTSTASGSSSSTSTSSSSSSSS